MLEKLVEAWENEYKELYKKLDKKWFKNLWENNADEYEFYELVKTIRPDLTFQEFDRAWQYRIILANNYKTAINEFINAVMSFY